MSKKQSIYSTSILVLFLIVFSSAHKVHTKIWLDANHNETTKEKGVYYRPKPKKIRKKYLIVDFYKNGKKYREGKAQFTTPNKEKFTGVVTYYYLNESVSKKVSYKKGLKNGVYQEYFETGELSIQGKYEDDLKEGAWKTFYKAGKIKSKGQYSKGEKVGVWKTYYKNIYYSGNE